MTSREIPLKTSPQPDWGEVNFGIPSDFGNPVFIEVSDDPDDAAC
jgi:hypothetical protein